MIGWKNTDLAGPVLSLGEFFLRQIAGCKPISNCLRRPLIALESGPMKFFAAILVFVLFAFFISWGIVEMLKGEPWMLLSAMLVFMGTFIKYGCQSH